MWALRAAWDAAMATPELRSMRSEIQRLYSEACDASRRAAATARHYGGISDPRGLGRPESRVAEANEYAAACWAEHARADRAYHGRGGARETALRAAGLIGDDGREIQIGATSAEDRATEALRRTRRDYPPVEWGRSSATTKERIARWRARPEWERISDPRERISEGAA
jgi:hypothetical protein